MDAIALLCTLHAEGPVTLQRLRSHGCSTLDDLEALDADSLAPLLESTPAGARRFLREATNLAARLTDSGLPATVSPRLGGGASLGGGARPGVRATNPGVTRQDPGGPALDPPRSVEAPTEEPRRVPSAGSVADADDLHAGMSPTERVLIDRVLERWRGAGPNPYPGVTQEPTPAVPAESSPASEDVDLAPLVPGALSGLDAETSAALCAAGIGTLDALAGLEDADLVRLSGTGGVLRYTHVNRLRFLARRLVGSREPASAKGTEATAPRPAVPALERFSLRGGPADAEVQPILGSDYELHPSPRPTNPSSDDSVSEPRPMADDSAGPFA